MNFSALYLHWWYAVFSCCASINLPFLSLYQSDSTHCNCAAVATPSDLKNGTVDRSRSLILDSVSVATRVFPRLRPPVPPSARVSFLVVLVTTPSMVGACLHVAVKATAPSTWLTALFAYASLQFRQSRCDSPLAHSDVRSFSFINWSKLRCTSSVSLLAATRAL